MRFVAISDTHLARPALPEGDVLLHAGDLTYRGTLAEISEVAAWLEEQRRTKGFKHVVLVAGNHDWLFQKDPGSARQLMKERGLIYLEDSAVTITGADAIVGFEPAPGRITIYGSPWQPAFMRWAFNLPRGEQLARKWSAVPAGVDILLTHTPPHGVLDGVPTFDEDAYPSDESLTQRHVGCEALAEALGRIKPRVHVFGHVHSDPGKIESDGRLSLNAAIMNESYNPKWTPLVFDLA